MVQRGKGTGSLTEVAPGRWRLRHYVGPDPVTAKARYASKVISARNVTEARKALATFVVEHHGQVLSSTAAMSVVMDEYIKSLETKRRAVRTITEARRTVDRVIGPALGHVPVGELEGRHIDEMTRRYDDRAAATVRRYLAVLSAGLTFAMKQGWIDSNPMIRASVPALDQKSVTVPTKDELLSLIGAMPSDVGQMAVRLAVFTAARRGEVCGLRWSDIEGSTLHIQRSIFRHRGESIPKATKGNRSRRVVLGQPALETLYLWALDRLEIAQAVGVELAPDSYILSRWPDCSRPLNPDTLSAQVQQARDGLGLRHLHFHSLRHYSATELLGQGVSARDAAEVLGHADGGTLLLSTYAHPTSQRQRDAGAILGNLLGP